MAPRFRRGQSTPAPVSSVAVVEEGVEIAPELAEVLKTAGITLPPGATATPAAQITAAFEAGRVTAAAQSAALPRTEPNALFGPGIPVRPAAIDEPDPATGRPAPRASEYPVSFNLPGITGRLIPWRVLRDAADIGIIRRCIEVRKSQLTALDWDITIKPRAIDAEHKSADDKTPRAEVEKAMRDRLRPEIERLRSFWETPDRQNGLGFADWYGMLLEEILVLDALPIYPRHTIGGELYSLEVIDGSTIKPLINNRGMRPSPPNPAYQQILQGFPRGEYAASVSPDAVDEDNPLGVLNPWTADSLLYKRRVVRPFSPYGFSPVEQALTEINLWLNRQSWMSAEYDDGAVPKDTVELPKESPIKSPQELDDWEAALNGALSGNTRVRHRLKLLPPGATISQQRTTDERYRPDYDTFLIKLLCTYFDLSPTSLGFMETGGLGGASYHEGQEDVEQRKGVIPWTRWSRDLFNQIMTTYLDAPPEVEFRFLGLDDEDEAAAVAVTDQQIRGAEMTINEGRDKHGLDRFDFPEADEPFISTGRAVIFLRGELARQEATADAQVQANADTSLGKGPAPKPGSDPQDPGKTPPGKPSAKNVAKATELDAFARWASKSSHTRPFAFHEVGEDLAPVLTDLIKTDTPGAIARARAEARDARGRHVGPATGQPESVARVSRTSGAREPVLVPYRPGV